MRINCIYRFSLRIVMVLLLVASFVQAEDMCYPSNTDTELDAVYNDNIQQSWYPWVYGSTEDPEAVTDGMIGSHALRVQFSWLWSEFILFRSNSNLWDTTGKKALVFRVKGIRDNCEKQVWVHIRNDQGQTLGSVPITDYMISPELDNVALSCWQSTVMGGLYDSNKWYTVVIPLSALNAVDVEIKDIIFEGGGLASYGVGELGTIYLDEIWWVEGLEFPLAGYNANTAPITSVFDHVMTDGNGNIAIWPAVDHVVMTYTGEIADGDESSTDSTCITGTEAPYNNLILNYVGAGECSTQFRLNYLSYDGHPSYDYAWSGILGTPIYALADGEVVLSDCTSHLGVVNWNDVAINGSECLGLGTGYGKLIIDLDGPYMTSINHVSYVRPGLGVGSRVKAGEIVAYVGNTNQPELIAPHLHFGFLLDDGNAMYISSQEKWMGTYVDPYGWMPTNQIDPYRKKAVNVPLWK